MHYWEPTRSAQHDEQLAFLMNTAAKGLAQEDQHIAARVRGGRASPILTMQHAFGGVGPGLSYWLYETTLVYLTWRAWVDAGVSAALDWSLAQLEAGESSTRKGRARSYDLAVFCEERPFLFEAKSWSYYSPAQIGSALTKDAQKLRDFAGAPYLKNPSKHILLFGHDYRGDRHDDALCAEVGLRLVGKAMFPASTRARADDHFIITVLSVIP